MIYGSKHGKYWFPHIFYCNFTTMVSTKVKLWFLSSLENFWPGPWDTLSEVALFFEKMHKVFKNKVQGCSSPLNMLVEDIKDDLKLIDNTHVFEPNISKWSGSVSHKSATIGWGWRRVTLKYLVKKCECCWSVLNYRW